MAGLNPEMVRLNVGGRHYTTTRTTLISDPNSALAHMFLHPNPAMVDEDGRYFIDRNGNAFEPILEYLRSQRLLDFGISKERVLAEAEFFGLDKLQQMLAKKVVAYVHRDGFVTIQEVVSYFFYVSSL